MQDLRNKVDTQSDRWDRFKSASTLSYIAAYKLHTGAIGQVNKNLQMDNERFWAAFGFLWGLINAVAPAAVPPRLSQWAGRLVAKVDEVKKVGEEVAGDLFKYTWEQLGSNLKTLAKSTTLEKLSLDVSSPQLEAVSDDPLTYSESMNEIIKIITARTKSVLDELVKRADGWNETQARQFVSIFMMTSPYMNDLPNVDAPGFKKAVQKAAELCMWMQWAIAYEPKTNPSGIGVGNRLKSYDPILDRLWALDVPMSQVTRRERIGNGFYNTSAEVLDLKKFAEWGRYNLPASRAKREDLARRLRDALLQMEPKFKTSQVCRVGDSLSY